MTVHGGRARPPLFVGVVAQLDTRVGVWRGPGWLGISYLSFGDGSLAKRGPAKCTGDITRLIVGAGADRVRAGMAFSQLPSHSWKPLTRED